MMNKKYSLSFTSGGLFYQESLKIAALYVECQDWAEVREQVFAMNILQTRTLSSLKRIYEEIVARLKTLQPGELDYLLGTNVREQKYMLWMAVCRRYTFIADFALEVLRERYIGLKTDLHYEDFDSFFNRKLDWHPELEALSRATRLKLRQIVFRIMREADLLTDTNIINGIILSPAFRTAISPENRQDILLFPGFESAHGETNR